MDRRNMLLRAINQEETYMVAQWGHDSAPQFTRKRHVKFDTVVEALSDLTAAQAKLVESAYGHHENRTLQNDIFGGGQSGFDSDLTYDERLRIDALLGGTLAAAGESPDQAAAHRIDADAAELHSLLHGDLGEDQVRRVMTLLRRSAEANEQLRVAYAAASVNSLDDDLYSMDELPFLRARMLLNGDISGADSIEVDAAKTRIAAIDAKVAQLQEPAAVFMNAGVGFIMPAGAMPVYLEVKNLRAERAKLVEEIEDRIGT